MQHQYTAKTTDQTCALLRIEAEVRSQQMVTTAEKRALPVAAICGCGPVAGSVDKKPTEKLRPFVDCANRAKTMRDGSQLHAILKQFALTVQGSVLVSDR